VCSSLRCSSSWGGNVEPVLNERDATVCNEVQELNGKQARAVDLLAGESSDREVADAVSCDPSTVWRWRTRDPAFRAARNARRHEVWENSLDRVRSLLPRALDVVEHALDDDDRQAALNLLKLAGLGAVDLGRVGPIDAAVIEEAEERERMRREQERAEEQVRAAERGADLETAPTPRRPRRPCPCRSG
jgi:hypothetical protein